MGKRVTANGKAVATVTSAHFARATTPDMRKLGNALVDRKNYVETKELGAKKSKNTKFDGGEVWKSDSECGPPSKGVPDDHLIAVNGAHDSFAKAVSSSPDVFVEGMPVVRFGDSTTQNGGNCEGEIVENTGLADHIAQAIAAGDGIAVPKTVPTAKTKPKAGAPGASEAERARSDERKGPTMSASKEPFCFLEGIEVAEKRPPRKGAVGPNGDVIFETLVGTKMIVRALGEDYCADHPIWVLRGIQSAGARWEVKLSAEFETPAWGIPGSALGAGIESMAGGSLGSMFLHNRWRAYTFTCTSHDAEKKVQFFAMSNSNITIALGNTAQSGSGESGARVEAARFAVASYVYRINLRDKMYKLFSPLWRFVKVDLPTEKFKFMEGEWGLSAKWVPQADHRCLCQYGLRGSVTVLDAYYKFEKSLVAFLGPAGVAVNEVLELICRVFKLDIKIFVLSIKLGGKLKVDGSGGVLIDREGSARGAGMDLTGTASIYADGALEASFAETVKGAAGVKVSFGVSLGLKLGFNPGLYIAGALKCLGVDIAARIELSFDLGMVGRAAIELLLPAGFLGTSIKWKTSTAGTIEKEWKSDPLGAFKVFDGPIYP